ncbi:MAG: hypothetical protein H6560_14920 [Lewinellaceae bacterium]|nr:hypothetical protein [Lewinellaceae bacterium]
MPKINIPLLCLLPFLALFSCEKWDLEQQDFAKVEITSIDSLAIDSVRITGRILDLQGQIQNHGFVWTTQAEPPLALLNEGRRELGVKPRDEALTFSSVLQLEPNTRYQLRAYATLDGLGFRYSESIEYSTGNGKVYTLGLNYQRGASLEASGRLLGTEKGFVAVKHGFCWSTTNPQPTLEDYSVNLGERRNNAIFWGTVDGLQNDSLHYIRAYAVLSLNLKLDTVFGQVRIFNGNLNRWIQRADFAGGVRSGAISFVIDDKGYVGTGSFTDPATGISQYKNDLWEYGPLTNTWAQKADFGGEARSWAVGFSIGPKGYIGAGTGEYQLKDFWEYTPE